MGLEVFSIRYEDPPSADCSTWRFTATHKLRAVWQYSGIQDKCEWAPEPMQVQETGVSKYKKEVFRQQLMGYVSRYIAVIPFCHVVGQYVGERCFGTSPLFLPHCG